jgi:integrase
MPRCVLTPRTVSTLGSVKKREVVWDDHPQAPPRFGVRISSTKRTYVVCIGDTWISLGDVRGIGLEDARRLARVAIGRVAAGLDPRGDQPVEPSKVTVSQLLDKYISSRPLSPHTLRKYTEILKRHLGSLAGRQANALVRSDLRTYLDSFKSRSMRDYTFRLLRAAFRWGLEEEVKPDVPLVQRDPTRGLKELQGGKKRERFLTDAEIKAVWWGVEKLGVVKATYVRILLLLAFRRGEAYLSTWDMIDLDKGTWTLPPEIRKIKTDRKHRTPPLIVYLPALAVELLSRLRPHTNHRPFVLSVNNVAFEMKHASGVLDIAPHDLRRTAVGWMESEGAPPHILSGVLGRTGRLPGSEAADLHYIRGLRPKEVHAWLERWAGHVREVVRN